MQQDEGSIAVRSVVRFELLQSELFGRPLHLRAKPNQVSHSNEQGLPRPIGANWQRLLAPQRSVVVPRPVAIEIRLSQPGSRRLQLLLQLFGWSAVAVAPILSAPVPVGPRFPE